MASRPDEAPLRLMIYDRTCRGRPLLPGLSHAWGTGGYLYRALGRFDAWHGARSWEEALAWLAKVHPARSIGEVQFWGHGKWGDVRIDRDVLSIDSLRRDDPKHALLARIRDRLAPHDEPTHEPRWWFRTCETFGARQGHAFATALADFLGCRVAGHTYIIGHWQSGLHTLRPGETPTWSVDEGLREGTPEAPKRAWWSKRDAPNTLSFLHGQIPDGW